MMMIERRVSDLKGRLAQILGEYAQSIEFELFFSALIDNNEFNSTKDIQNWLQGLNYQQYFDVEEIPFSGLSQWHWDAQTGNLKHNSGKFFSIRGCQVYDGLSGELLWDQPIIDQPEIGVLGILCKLIDGILYLLMQAKAEPGNINTYQISPTVQATRSNYLQVHGGKKTLYLEYFNGQEKVMVLCDQYQSEQGARFLGKRNRNILVLTEDASEIGLSENHRWLTLGQLKSLMEFDNTVNMDTRSVISQIDYYLPHGAFDPAELVALLLDHRDIVTRSEFWLKAILQPGKRSEHTLGEIRNRLTWNRYFTHVDKRLVALRELSQWQISDKEIAHKEGKYFKVLAVKIQADNREVDSWDQPIIKQRHEGRIGLLGTEINGQLHFLAQLKLEPGLYDLIEFAPTVQYIEENHPIDAQPPFVNLFESDKSVYSAKQSEEGGRFYRECSINMIGHIEKERVADKPGYIWLTLMQLKEMVQFQQLLNVELRSLLAYF